MTEAVYDVEFDASNVNDARVAAVGFVGSSKRVLEFGCSTGRVTEVLAAQGCRITGVEIDSEAAERARQFADEVFVIDIDVDLDDLAAKVSEERWEVALFGDVLEHLRDPLQTLRITRRLLDPHGMVVVSVPNVAHIDVRLTLLHGDFPYGPYGLLDRTHLRFFTLESLNRLMADSGFVIVDLKRMIIPAFATELNVRPSDFPPAVVEEILPDPEAEVYQYVVRAVVDNGDTLVHDLADRCVRLEAELERATEALQVALGEAESRIRESAEAEVWVNEFKALQRTKLMRYSKTLRGMYGRLRRNSSP
jgi:2-polyprenyl-3-methyl-5-hydroxy-6-metoxy-1,4-benzoquinol methylase